MAEKSGSTENDIIYAKNCRIYAAFGVSQTPIEKNKKGRIHGYDIT
jgi:hypothetical protein